MTLTLGMMFHQGDLPFLKLHMPYLRQGFSEVIAGSDCISSEAADYLRTLGVEVVPVPFNDHWAESLNALINTATNNGHTKMLRLDPDELIFVQDAPKIEAGLDAYRYLAFPRHNFWYSREMVDVNAWPDTQLRAWRLDGNVRYQGKRHEGIPYQAGELGQVVGVELFHYGDASTTGYMQKALKYERYRRRDAGLPDVDKLPDDVHPGANVMPFLERQPLNPAIIGKFAPFKE